MPQDRGYSTDRPQGSSPGDGPDTVYVHIGSALVDQLRPFAGETGQTEGAVAVLTRLIAELQQRRAADPRRPHPIEGQPASVSGLGPGNVTATPSASGSVVPRSPQT